MNSKDNAKANILKGVSQKLKIKRIKVALISIVSCLSIGLIAYIMLFVKQTPVSVADFKDANATHEITPGDGKPLGVNEFYNVKIELKRQTINEVDNRELPYNVLFLPVRENLLFSTKNYHFYAENHTNGTATLYFYMSQSLIQKMHTPDSGKAYLEMLLYPELCHTEETLNEITNVYYLVYNYDNMNKADFDKAKTEATLLWSKYKQS